MNKIVHLLVVFVVKNLLEYIKSLQNNIIQDLARFISAEINCISVIPTVHHRRASRLEYKYSIFLLMEIICQIFLYMCIYIFSCLFVYLFIYSLIWLNMINNLLDITFPRSPQEGVQVQLTCLFSFFLLFFYFILFYFMYYSFLANGRYNTIILLILIVLL